LNSRRTALHFYLPTPLFQTRERRKKETADE
jgi:hypothetical protein